MENGSEKYNKFIEYNREDDSYYLISQDQKVEIDPLELKINGFRQTIRVVTEEEILESEKSFVRMENNKENLPLDDFEFTEWLYTMGHATKDKPIDRSILCSFANDFFVDFMFSKMNIVIETEVLENFDMLRFRSFIYELVYVILSDNLGVYNSSHFDQAIARDAYLFVQSSFFLEDLESSQKYVDKYLGSSKEMQEYINQYLSELLGILYDDEHNNGDGDDFEF